MFPTLRPVGAALQAFTAVQRRTLLRLSTGALLILTLPLAASAHGVSKGDLLIDHPYAVPSVPGEASGYAYFRGIQNSGTHAERLLGASSPLAARVELRRLKLQAGKAQTTPVDGIDLPPKSLTLLRHTGDYQFALMDLKHPLKDGDRFEVTLNFEHAGQQTVQVWVQTPHAAQVSHSEH
ncbi:MAG TPA: copper chaperone PCu(A)C [Rhodoferax sp.]